MQEESRKEQAHLLRSVSSRYVGVLGTDGMEDYKDFFFKHYPFLVANAVIWGFHYLCPGSRHLYSNAFKRVLYLQCARILSGIEARDRDDLHMYEEVTPFGSGVATSTVRRTNPPVHALPSNSLASRFEPISSWPTKTGN